VRGIVCVRHNRLLHTESFRLAAGFALLYIAFAVALIAISYWIVDRIQIGTLMDALDADIATVSSGYKQQGIEEAQEVVNQLLAPHGDAAGGRAELYMGLQDRSGRILAGNLATQSVRLGVRPYRLAELRPVLAGKGRGEETQTQILTRGVTLPDGSYLLVGRSMAPILLARSRIARAFSWTTAVAVMLAVGAGIAFGTRFTRRIDAMAATCQAVVDGHFSNRIPLRGNDDELDRLAVAVNIMLDRIEALLENLRQVSSDIAHDLRTPLTRLRQRLEQAQHESYTLERYSAAVTRALADSDELLSMFTALLRISQIEAGTRKAGFSAVSLSDLGRRVFEMYQVVAQDMGHTLLRQIQVNVVVQGDQELLLQLWVNLIENALRHTPAGTRVELLVSALDGGALLAVGDNGPGVPESERERVLRRFYRLADSRTERGHGLGLALVAAIASLHGAELVLADNAPGLRVSLLFRAGSLRDANAAEG